MNRFLLPLVLLGAILCAPLAALAAPITIDWVTVDGAPNAADPVDGDSFSPASPHFGAVSYAYRIDKYDVTNNQYVEFLNSNDPTGINALGLYSDLMTFDEFGGIDFASGAPDGSKYSAISGRGQRPVNNVSWFDAIRFANWLNNGQTPGSTETGAYTLDGTPNPVNSNLISRNPGAKVFLPSQDEWYKAAYYNPATSSYYRYPTSSDTAPASSSPTATPNSANYGVGGAGNLTDVGAYSGTTSPYGAFDMAGNVWQWNESFGVAANRVFRGGSFFYTAEFLAGGGRNFRPPFVEFGDLGFRVAAVIPEPSTGVMAAIAGCMLCLLRKQFKKP